MNQILEKIHRTVENDPGRTAYTANGSSIAYGALWNAAEVRADLLRRQGTSPVVIFGDKEISVVISILACLMAGRTYVPVRSDTPLPRLARILALTGSALLLTEKNVTVDGAECLSPDALTRFAGKEPKEADGGTAYAIFTSGSTGDPKGVPIGVENLENFVDWISSLEPLRGCTNATVFNQASFSFDLSVADFYFALCNGHTLAALCCDIGDDPEGALRTLAQADVAVMTPTFARLCLLCEGFEASRLPKLKCIYFCGERLDARTVRRLFAAFPALRILNAYGPTEATSAVSAIEITPAAAETDAELPVGDAENFATEVVIEDGEIVLKGKSVFGGYLGDTAGGYFRENGENGYRTGDLGRIENGMLFCGGRKDRQVKYKGCRIELDDIERNIARVGGVKDCAVVAKKNADGAVRLIKAFVVSDGTVGAEVVKSALAGVLPAYMIPKSIRLVDRLPVNGNGKTDRKELETW